MPPGLLEFGPETTAPRLHLSALPGTPHSLSPSRVVCLILHLGLLIFALAGTGCGPKATPERLRLEISFAQIPLRERETLGLLGLTSSEADGITPPTTPLRLNPAQLRDLLSDIRKTEGAELVTTPKVLTGHGLKTRMNPALPRVPSSTVNTNAGTLAGNSLAPQDLQAPGESVTALEVTPYLLPDQLRVRLNAVASVPEFLGYDLSSDSGYDDYVAPPEHPPGYSHGLATLPAAFPAKPAYTSTILSLRPRRTVPIPLFGSRQHTADLTLQDGQTLVLSSGPLADAFDPPPQASRPVTGPRRKPSSQYNSFKRLLILITPRLLDSKGNPVHSNEELTRESQGDSGQ